MRHKAAARVLLVYGYEPSGHSAAAFALEEAFRRRGAVVSRVEVASGHHPAAGSAVARAYHALLRGAPAAWGGLYASPRVRAVLRGVRSSYLALGGARRLRAGVAREAPDAVVCPQASVAAVLAAARARGELDVPVVSVLTDYGVHPFWAEPPADRIVVPDARAAAELAALGVPPWRVRAAGIPVHAAFAAPPPRPQARRALALASAAPVVLLSGGSHGHGDLGGTAAALLALAPRAHILVLCGRNERLRLALSTRREAGGRLRAFGPQPPEFVATLLAAADLHAGKPGGLTAAESLALGVPMILAGALPGQERENARRLLALGAAEPGGGPEETARACARLLARPARLALLGAAARRAGRPDAAAEIARFVAGEVLISDAGRL